MLVCVRVWRGDDIIEHSFLPGPAFVILMLGVILMCSRLAIFIVLRHFRILYGSYLSLCSLMIIFLPCSVSKEVKRGVLRRQGSWRCDMCLSGLCIFLFLGFFCGLSCSGRAQGVFCCFWVGGNPLSLVCIGGRVF